MNGINIPNTGQVLFDGDIVILNDIPKIKWIVHYGWYIYKGQKQLGWYFCSIPDQNKLPITDLYLELITVVSSSSGCCCPPDHNPIKPPHPENIPGLSRAFITVDTISQRNELNKKLVPHGKLVRVNDAGDGYPVYYEWDQIHQIWIKTNLSNNSENTLYWSKIFSNTNEGD